MQYKQLYIIEKWEDWAHKLNESIYDFFNKYSVYPNIMQANKHTYSQIDNLINIQGDEKRKLDRFNEHTFELEKPKKDEYVEISSFDNDDASVVFAIDNNLYNRELLLVYAKDTSWSSEQEMPVDPIEAEIPKTTE